MKDLPIYPYLDSIADALFSSPSRFLVLTAETAAGKSTAVPVALLPRVKGSIVMLEPRRIATVAVASRVAELLGEDVGKTAGYRLHLESRVSRETRIEVVTEAILTRRLQGDPSLEGVSVVILDEFHERSVHADLALAFLRETVTLRDDLFVLVMSATIDTERIAAWLDAPVCAVPGRRWPVAIEYAPGEARNGGRIPSVEEQCAAAIVRELSRKDTGGILAFLPGIAEIRRTERLLADCPAEVLVLHSSVPLVEQKKALQEPLPGTRRVILSSSIAETSLTVPGVTTVVDSGLSRMGRVDLRTGMSALQTGYESAFSAEQRAGRAGRLGPGRCVRLWAERDVRVSNPPPEILRTDLLSVVLECALWGVSSIDGLSWLDRPSEAAWNQARALLEWQDALDQDGRITERGRAMTTLGVHPRIAAVALAGSVPLAVRYSLRGESPREAERFADDLSRRLERLRAGDGDEHTASARVVNGSHGSNDASSPMALLAGFPDRIACHVGDGVYRFPSGRLASLPREIRNGQSRYPKWIVAPEVDAGEREGRIYSFETLDESQAETWLDRHASTETVVSFSDGQYSPGSKVRKTEIRAYGKIVLAERPLEPAPSDVIGAVLSAVRNEGLSVLPWKRESEAFLARARFYYAASIPTGRYTGQPINLSEKALLDSLEDWLAPFIPANGRIDETGLLDALRYRANGQLIDREIPERLELPNGIARAITFEEPVPGEGPKPVLEIRVQDLFGCAETPRVLGIPVLLKLLSPARRPLQITSDLASFWKNTWPEVRKEMKGRYPKHKWPEDPFAPIR
ncbi:MAG TPA: ATP-dependent helicase HrpB [Treponemataceae bacterium]|nr:ATP-dependent helicase HrpB [Treponemataceae bacterium]